MASTQPRYSKEEFAQRGDTIFENEISPHLVDGDNGKVVAIDIETSAYEIDADELTACHRLRTRIPDAQIWLMRVGSRYLHRYGGHEQRTES